MFDPEASGTISAKTHHHKVDRSIFEGFEVKGLPSHVVVNGRVQYAKGSLDVETPFSLRKPCPAALLWRRARTARLETKA